TDQVRSHLNTIFWICILGSQTVAHVLDYSARLLANVQAHRSHLIGFRACNRIVGASRTRPGHDKEVTRSLHVRILPPWLSLPLDDLTFHFAHIVIRQDFVSYSRTQILFSSE